MRIVSSLVLLTSLTCSSGFAQNKDSSELPASNGFILRALRNTVSSAVLENLKMSDLKINQGLVPARKNTNTQFARAYNVNFKITDDSDHLVFYIPGFGGQADSGHAKYLIELLSRNGFSAASLDSPASYRFISESSYHGVPGINKFDNEDLLEGIKRSKVYLESLRLGKRFSKVSVIGGSLGGYNASQLALLLKNNQEFKFHRIVAMNPPVSNVYGLTLVDHLSEVYRKQVRQDLHGIGIINHIDTFIKAFLNKLNLPVKFDEVSDRIASVIDPSIPLNKKDLMFLMGYEFSEMIDNAIEGTRKRNAIPVELNSKTFYGIFNSVSMRFSNRLNVNLVTKIDKPIINTNSAMLSKIRRESPTKNLERLDDITIESSSIEQNVSALSQIENFVILTTQDDFLLRIPTAFQAFGAPYKGIDDSRWILRNFNGKYDPILKKSNKARSYVYNEGGHLGGLPYNSIQKTLLQVLSEE